MSQSKKKTPKVLAQDYLAQEISNAISIAQEKLSSMGEWQQMTEKEKLAFKKQLKKIADRSIKPCGYDEAWYS